MSKRKASPLDPDDVLAGRVKPSAADLLQLIHRENPTGRELPTREAELRYARKARLQSLLVHRFADELEVALDPAQPGTVSLRHRGHGRDACHAVLASLDEDARSWVQRELDLAASAAPEAVAPALRVRGRVSPPAVKDDGEEATPEALVRRAEAALEAYDYESARTALEQALQVSHGAAEPAAALLALLVETLGDDAGALAIEAKIAKAALAEARVRGPLALAAARSGHEERALGMTRGLADAEVARVFAALAASALTAGDIERATAHVDQAKRHDAACPEIIGVAGDVAKARAKACEPVETEISALLAAGRDEEAEKKASAALTRWPESAVARRALRDIEERRRKRDAVERAAEAEEAAVRGETAVALALFAQAAAAARGADREAIDRRMHEIEAASRAHRETAQVEQALQALDAADPQAGLTIYAGFEEVLRARVRARSVRPELGWIDHMESARGGDRARAQAATAIVEALAALPIDPEAALALLAPHEAALGRVPEARRIAREAEATLRGRRIACARAAIAAARIDLASGAAEEALIRLGAASLRDLPDEERAEAVAVEAAATRLVERCRREDEARRLRAAGRFFEARALVEALAAGADSAEGRERLEQERDTIRAEIRRSFRVEFDDEPRSAEELGRFRPHAVKGEAPWWLTADGRGIVIVRAHERWVIVRVVDCATMQIHPTILLRTPEPLGDVDVTVCGPTLWLTGQRGALVEIAMAGWEVRDFRPSADVAAPADVVERAILVTTEDLSAPRHFWVACRARDETFPERLRVFDLAQRRVVREIAEPWHVETIAGFDEPRLAVLREQACVLYTPRGIIAPHGRLDLRLRILQLAAAPIGEGLIALMSEPFRENPDREADVARSVYVAVISPLGLLGAVMLIPGADPDKLSSLAVARGSRLIHGISTGEMGESLFALTVEDDLTLSTPLYAVGIGSEAMLVQDAHARRIVALVVHDHGVDVFELGATPPLLPARSPRPIVHIPGTYDLLSCNRPSDEADARALVLASAWRGHSEAHILGLVRGLEQASKATPENLVPVVFALRSSSTKRLDEEADRMVQRLLARFPRHPEVRLLHANALAKAEQWAATREALLDVEPSALDESQAQHFHHLRALTAIREGRFAEAAKDATAALALDGRCDLESLADLTQDETPAATSTDTAAGSPLVQLLAAIRVADACFTAQDPGGALRALDVPVVWYARERQSLARLAEAYLAFTPGARAPHLRKLVTLGALVDHVDEIRPMDRRSLPLPGAWDAERVADVAERARGWLAARGSQEQE